MRRAVLTALACVLVVSASTGSASGTDSASAGRSMGEALGAFIAREGQQGALQGSVSALVLDAASGSTLFSRDADAAVLPASSLKLLTAAAALESLGPQHQLSTQVRVFNRNMVVLEGGGDPLLTGDAIDVLADRTKKWWQSRHAGRSVPVLQVGLNATLFGPFTPAPGWFPEYVPREVSPVTALGRIGDRSSDPALRASTRFVKRLREAGLKVWFRGALDHDVPTGAALVARTGHSVEEAVRVMLLRSDNTIAEVLFRHVARSEGMEPGSWEHAEQASLNVLKRLSIDVGADRMVDGSGLSRENRVRPRTLVQVLRAGLATGQLNLRPLLARDSIPIAGQTGTLKNRFRSAASACARGKVLAKTGTLHDVISLAGVADTPDGGRRVFAFVVNNQPASVSDQATRRALDEMAAIVAGCQGEPN